MNIEKLYTLANDIVEENKKLQYVSKLQNVIGSIQGMITQPNVPQHQTNLSNQLSELKKTLESSLVNELSPAWYQVLVDLEIDGYLGNKIVEKIDNIFSSNQITPANSKQELEKLFSVLNQKMTGFTNIVSGLKVLGIEKDELEEDECEIGVMIPRDYIENDLGKFGEEIKELNFIFNNFSELIVGEKSSFELRNLSTSEPLITVATVTAIAAGVAKTIGWLIDSYKSLLEIKKLKFELSQQGVPEEHLKGITDHSNEFMKKKIDGIVKKLGKEYKANGDSSRKNELLNGVRISLNKIANRIDNGFNFEVRVEPAKSEGTEDNEEQENTDIAAILEASKSLQFMKLDGKPILSLSEKKEKEK